VKRIFEGYLSGRDLYATAEQLTREGISSPSAHDPEHNRHRHGRPWSKMAVRAILANPRYTGRAVRPLHTIAAARRGRHVVCKRRLPLPE
jgi:site-specific DNA recombinase